MGFPTPQFPVMQQDGDSPPASGVLRLLLPPDPVLLLLRAGDPRAGHLERVEDLVQLLGVNTLSRRISSRTDFPLRFASRDSAAVSYPRAG